MNLQRAKRAGARRRARAACVTVELESGATLQARSVVLSTGARWRQMGVPGEDEYRNKGVTYCPHCDGPLFKGKRVAVIGGGNSGVEAAIDLAGVVAHVTLIEFDDRLRADDVLQRKLRSLPNVDVVVSAPHHRGARRRRASSPASLYEDRATGEIEHRSTSTASSSRSACCRTPSGWRAAVELSARGEIVIDDRGADVGARRVRRRRLHHGAVQADRDRHGSGLHRRPQRLRPPDPDLRPRRRGRRRGRGRARGRLTVAL